jgi:hypothetical protein
MLLPTGAARAAGGAYGVDDAGVDDPGACKVETWLSYASSRDLTAVGAPACVFNIFRPVELGFALERSRSDGEWGTSLGLHAKTNLVPITTGGVGAALTVGTGFDLISGDHTDVSVVVPLTYQPIAPLNLNVNLGWLWDRAADTHFLTWGAGADWRVTEKIMLTAEVFGQAGSGAPDPAFQTGVRFTPKEWFDIDVIYGRNLNGADANWITVGLNVRFNLANAK